MLESLMYREMPEESRWRFPISVGKERSIVWTGLTNRLDLMCWDEMRPQAELGVVRVKSPVPVW